MAESDREEPLQRLRREPQGPGEYPAQHWSAPDSAYPHACPARHPCHHRAIRRHQAARDARIRAPIAVALAGDFVFNRYAP